MFLMFLMKSPAIMCCKYFRLTWIKVSFPTVRSIMPSQHPTGTAGDGHPPFGYEAIHLRPPAKPIDGKVLSQFENSFFANDDQKAVQEQIGPQSCEYSSSLLRGNNG